MESETLRRHRQVRPVSGSRTYSMKAKPGQNAEAPSPLPLAFPENARSRASTSSSYSQTSTV